MARWRCSEALDSRPIAHSPSSKLQDLLCLKRFFQDCVNNRRVCSSSGRSKCLSYKESEKPFLSLKHHKAVQYKQDVSHDQ